MSFLSPYIYFIAISFLASLRFLVRPIPGFEYLKAFPFFLISTITVEFIGNYLSSIRVNNVMLYNFFSMLEFSFFLAILGCIIENRRTRKVIWGTIVGYIIAAVCNIFFLQGVRTFHTYTYCIGCLLIVIFSIYYFYELFKYPKSVKLKNNPSFWICSGLLFYYCCGFPLFGLINTWGNISRLILNNFDSIVTILNIFLYSIFTIAFLCRTRRYTL